MNEDRYERADVKRFCIIACRVLWRELCHVAASSPHIYDFRFLEQGLHNTPALLREQLQQAIDEVEGDYAAILIGYGLCSNGIEGIKARSIPLVCMRGHDCITFLLGSKERYREYFDQHPGTYWYSPGWIDTTLMPGPGRYDKILQKYVETYGEENAEYLVDIEQTWMSHYTNAAYVDLGFADSTKYKEFTKQCAEWLGWNCDVLTGEQRLARNFLSGNWDSNDFLIVQPGETIVPTHDDQIIGARREPDNDRE